MNSCAFLKVLPYSLVRFVEMIAWAANAVSHNWLPLYPCKILSNVHYIITWGGISNKFVKEF